MARSGTRAASPTLTPTGGLVRIEGDRMQQLAVQPDRRDRSRFFVDHSVECLAIRDGAGYAESRIEPDQGDAWSPVQVDQLAVACVAHAMPDPSQPLDPSFLRARVIEEHPESVRPAPGGFEDPSELALGEAQANRFLDITRELEIDELGQLE